MGQSTSFSPHGQRHLGSPKLLVSPQLSIHRYPGVSTDHYTPGSRTPKGRKLLGSENAILSSRMFFFPILWDFSIQAGQTKRTLIPTIFGRISCYCMRGLLSTLSIRGSLPKSRLLSHTSEGRQQLRWEGRGGKTEQSSAWELPRGGRNSRAPHSCQDWGGFLQRTAMGQEKEASTT